MVSLEHVSASLRAVDAAGKGIRTVSGVRRGISALNVADFLSGINGITSATATNAVFTKRDRLVDQP